MLGYVYIAAALGAVALIAYRYGRYKEERRVVRRAELLLCLTDQGLVSKDSSGQQPRHICDWLVRLGQDDFGLMHRYCARCHVLLDQTNETPSNLVILGNYRHSKKKMVASEVSDSTPPTAA